MAVDNHNDETCTSNPLEQHPNIYICHEYHPNARREDWIECIDVQPSFDVPSTRSATHPRLLCSQPLQDIALQPPWAPSFRTRADFEVAELAVETSMKGKHLERYLRGVGPPRHHESADPSYVHPFVWHLQSNVTFTSVSDFHRCLDLAAKSVLKVQVIPSCVKHDLILPSVES